MSQTRSRLDPRAPLVFDTRELGRRAGSLRPLRRTVPAPDALRTELSGVPAGAPLELDLRLEAVMEGVLVSGTVAAPVEGECGRCLDPVSERIEVDVQQLFVYPDGHPGAAGDGSLDEDDDLGVIEDDRIDLEPTLRDALVLALPLTPLCGADCPGLCPECGARLADEPGHGHDRLDPRWAALGALGAFGHNDVPVAGDGQSVREQES